MFGGEGRCGNRRTSFPFLSRFLRSPSLPSFCLKQIKMAELSSLEEKMEVLMEVQLSLPQRRAGVAVRRAHRNSISCCEPGPETSGISFPPTAAATPRWAARLPGGRAGGERGRGGARLLGFLPATRSVARGTVSPFFSCSQAENPRHYWRESCQAFSGIDPARLWLAGGQKTKYFLLLRRGKEI